MDREKDGVPDLEILKYLAKTAPENQESAIAYTKGQAISLSEEETEKLSGIVRMQQILAEYSSRSGRTSGEVLIGLFSTEYRINEVLKGSLEKIQEELPERTGKAITDLDDSDELDILITEGEHYFPKLV